MKHFDEYQKMLRYKHGYYAFLIIIALHFTNFSISGIYGIQWAETQRLESLIIIMIAVIYTTVMYTYSGAYFAKWENPLFFSLFYLVPGALITRSAFYFPIIENGQATQQIIGFIAGINFFAIPVTYLVKRMAEKVKDAKEDKEA